jgi:prephenate dehydratase
MVGPEDMDLKGITTVLSHPKAHDQSRSFIETLLPKAECINYGSTSAAYKEMITKGDPTVVAICSEDAIINGGYVHAKGTQISRKNRTEFLVLANPEIYKTDKKDLYLIILDLNNVTSSLHMVTGIISEEYGSNMTYIESRKNNLFDGIPVRINPETRRVEVKGKMPDEEIVRFIIEHEPPKKGDVQELYTSLTNSSRVESLKCIGSYELLKCKS